LKFLLLVEVVEQDTTVVAAEGQVRTIEIMLFPFPTQLHIQLQLVLEDLDFQEDILEKKIQQ